jgi:hypothetical protein
LSFGIGSTVREVIGKGISDFLLTKELHVYHVQCINANDECWPCSIRPQRAEDLLSAASQRTTFIPFGDLARMHWIGT